MKTICENCHKGIEKSTTDYKKAKHHYCSVRCSNIHRPRRKLEGKCKICKKVISSKRTYCKKCFDSSRVDDMKIKDMFYNQVPSSKYSKIRARARRIYNPESNLPCQICGYNLHTEVCHIKMIKDFTDDTLVKVVNDPNNIIILCRNCHWELDNGYLYLPIISSGS